MARSSIFAYCHLYLGSFSHRNVICFSRGTATFKENYSIGLFPSSSSLRLEIPLINAHLNLSAQSEQTVRNEWVTCGCRPS
jgi:hypothetical protein